MGGGSRKRRYKREGKNGAKGGKGGKGTLPCSKGGADTEKEQGKGKFGCFKGRAMGSPKKGIGKKKNFHSLLQPNEGGRGDHRLEGDRMSKNRRWEVFK